MTISSINTQSVVSAQSLIDMRNQLDDLQRQLGTGQKSVTYAGVGFQRGLAVGLRQQLSALGGFDDAITNVGVRIQIANTALSQIATVGSQVKASANAPVSISSDGSTIPQQGAYGGLDQILGLLNTPAGDHYLFSGSAADKPAVDSLDHILNGNGAQAGLKQVIAERNQADLGSNGLGRLVISSPTATSVNVAEDVAGSPFGFKLSSVSSTLTGATVTGPTGSPAGISVDLGASNPNAGDSITLNVTLPDGTSESVSLVATASATPGANEFTLGATPAATAANLQAATTTAFGKLASTSLAAASAVAAGNDFFNTDSTHPPQRVAGPNFATATSLVAGTASNTVNWYIGEDGTGSARSSATARIDSSIAVNYGIRANEQGIRSLVRNAAVLSSVTFNPNDPNSAARSSALAQRVSTNLDKSAGTQDIQEIETDLAAAQTSLTAASDRHTQTKNTLTDMVQQIETVPAEQVATQMMALQTSLQASLQATALLSKLSLVNYLS